MNSEASPASLSPESLPDYKLAAQELDSLFASLLHDAARPDKPGRLNYHISAPKFATDKDGWDHFAYKVTYSLRAANGADGPSHTFDWRAGVGCVDWKAVKRNPRFMFRNDNAIDSLSSLGGKLSAHGKMLQNEVMSSIAELTSARTVATDKERAANPALANARRMIKPLNPAEVLARCCAEGQEANEAFPDWCANLGYEEDSRAALAMYLACQEGGVKARAIAGRHFAKMAELSVRL